MQNRERKHAFSCTASQGTNVTVGHVQFSQLRRRTLQRTLQTWNNLHTRFIEIHMYFTYFTPVSSPLRVYYEFTKCPQLPMSLLESSASLQSTVPVLQRSCVRIPFKAEIFAAALYATALFHLFRVVEIDVMFYQPFNRFRFPRNVIFSSFCDSDHKTKTVAIMIQIKRK